MAAGTEGHDRTSARGGREIVIAGALTALAAALSAVEPSSFDGWPWLAATLVVPVVFGLALPLYRESWRDLRRRSVTPAILASVGALTGFGWSIVAAVRDRDDEIHFAAAALIVTLGLAGRRVAPSVPPPVDTTARTARYVAGATVVAVVLVALGWTLFGESRSDGMAAVVSVLMLISPGGMALAAPLATRFAVARGAELDIILNDASAFERAVGLGSVVLMKSGTVTSGEVRLTSVLVGPEADAGLTSDVARIETFVDHPVARAIAGSSPADERSGGPLVDDVRPLGGRGVTGTVDGRPVVVGHRRLFAAVAVPVAEQVDGLRPGTTVVYAGRGDRADAAFVLSDSVRERAAGAVAALGRGDVRTLLLTGDSAASAGPLAAELGFDDVVADAGPSEKAAVGDVARRDDRPVALVGDAIADAPALAAADLGIGFGSTTGASPIVVGGDDLRRVADGLALARAAHATVVGNLRWAVGVHAAAVPFAALGWLDPTLLVATMLASALLVVVNSRRLRTFGRSGA